MSLDDAADADAEDVYEPWTGAAVVAYETMGTVVEPMGTTNDVEPTGMVVDSGSTVDPSVVLRVRVVNGTSEELDEIELDSLKEPDGCGVSVYSVYGVVRVAFSPSSVAVMVTTSSDAEAWLEFDAGAERREFSAVFAPGAVSRYLRRSPART